MNAKRVLFGLLLSLTALAVATVYVTSEVHGNGRAVNGDGIAGEFNLEATMTSRGDHVTRRGNFEFQSRTSEHRIVNVKLREVDAMQVVDNVANVGGPGRLRVQEGSTVHEFAGRVYVTATSNRHPEETGDNDTIVVRFVPAVQTNPSYTFTGTLNRGDISVATTRSY